ncbi:bifunctional DNA primase/polymerase [Pelomicrobium sp.]|uniref:bifunctional DNA primase/polymerase n=1 Tax=Pelomicrobium sp. TaxID=2815319 RepID=UPI002FDE3043
MSESRPSPLAAARGYLARGWSVVPVEPRGKRPVVPWAEFQRRLPTPEELEAWFHRCGDANLAIVTGAMSQVVVLDVDPRHGGEASLAALIAEHGALPVTVEAITGGGGRHYYFSHPGGVVPNRVAIASGLDLRGDGGMVVAPPSRHPSGRRYAWVPGRSPDEVPLAPVPPWLLRLVLPARPRAGHPITHWRTLVQEGVAQGQRNNTIASLAGHLLWHGVDPQVVLELLLAWNRVRCRPPLADDEVVRVVESILRLHERERGAPFDPGQIGLQRPR